MPGPGLQLYTNKAGTRHFIRCCYQVQLPIKAAVHLLLCTICQLPLPPSKGEDHHWPDINWGPGPFSAQQWLWRASSISVGWERESSEEALLKGTLWTTCMLISFSMSHPCHPNLPTRAHQPDHSPLTCSFCLQFCRSMDVFLFSAPVWTAMPWALSMWSHTESYELYLHNCMHDAARYTAFLIKWSVRVMFTSLCIMN